MDKIYSLDKDAVFSTFNTSENGLDEEQAKIRLQENGLNTLPQAKKQNTFQKFLKQFKDLFIIILLICAGLSLIFREFADAIIIFLVVLFNAIIGVVQESKAENAMQSLKNLTKPYAKVIRNGKSLKILSEELVVGDVVLLEAGDFVPADLRLINTASLKIEESSLTGESVATSKISYSITDSSNLPLGDQQNMAFMGSSVTYGRGTGVVVSTGKNTEMGKIATSLTESEDLTLLQKRVNKTSKVLSVIILIVCLIIFLIGTIRNPNNFIQCFMVAVSIAVCAIPEGLPTGITITMSLGVANMSKKKAIVKKLSTVETLGSTQIICSDKTGTLTLNKMTVKEIFINQLNEMPLLENPNFLWLVNVMLLCNDTKIDFSDNNASLIGDPTENALVSYAQSYGFSKDNFDGRSARINEIPFDSERKLMTTINNVDGNNYALTKGAVDCLINRCNYILENGQKRPITQQDKDNILLQSTLMGEKALRVLAYAYKSVNGDIYNISSEEIENDLTFIGLTGMIDPPRPEVKDAITTCVEAGIKVIMITGDHKDTAFAIAKEIGIAKEKSQVLTGTMVDSLSDKELAKKIDHISVFARVNPEHKVRIVKALKAHNYIVAMTGDGVNDAPSIKQADIGIGMGITGTDVSKEVADMILTDDNFSTIVSAVKEGRRIYSNILRIIVFLFSTCFAELILMFTVISILGLNLFTAPVILWINIVSDTFPALALGVEQAEKDIMKQKPNTARGSLFGGINGIYIFLGGFLQGLLLLTEFLVCYYLLGLSNQIVSTICFVSLVFLELFFSFNMRDIHHSIFNKKIFSNKFLNGAFIISALLTIGFIYLLPTVALTEIGLAKISFSQLAISILVSSLILPLHELFKFVVNKIYKRKKATK